jgi:hypothetical protein
VLLTDLREPWAREAMFESHQWRPEPAVHQSYLALDEPAHQQIARSLQLAQYGENLMARRVRPPAAADRPAYDHFHQARRRTFARHEHGTVRLDKSQRSGGIHHCRECIEAR